MFPPARRRNPIGRSRQAGQSLAELAVAIPALMLLMLGGFDATLMISDQVTATYAVRQGARLGAEIGGIETNPGATTGQIDQQIVRNVLAVTSGMTDATIKEVDIYTPSSPSGVYQSGDPVDQFFISAGSAVSQGTQTFPIQNRNQTPPFETSIGIRLIWTFSAPAGVFPSNMILDNYAVMKASPVLQ